MMFVKSIDMVVVNAGLRFCLYVRIMRRLTYGSEFIQSGGGLQALGNRGNRLKIVRNRQRLVPMPA